MVEGFSKCCNMVIVSDTSLMRIPGDAESPRSDPVSLTMILCDGLLLPTVITVVGKVFFSHIESAGERIFMVGVIFP